MKKSILIWLLLTILTVLLLSGCSTSARNTTEAESETLLTAEYSPFFQVIAEDLYLKTAAFSDDTLYYPTYTVDAAGIRRYTMHTYDLASMTDAVSYALFQDGMSHTVDFMAVTPEQNLILLDTVQDPETVSSGSVGSDQGSCYELLLLSPEGKELMCCQFAVDSVGEAVLFPIDLAADADENIYVGFQGTNSIILIFDRDGRQVGQIDCEDSLGALFTNPDGQVYGISYHENPTGGEWLLQKTDLSGSSLGTAYRGLPAQNALQSAVAWEEHSVLLSIGDSLYLYDWEKETCQELFSWSYHGVDASQLLCMAVMPEKRIAVFTSNSLTSRSELVLMLESSDPMASELSKDKTVLVLGVTNLDYMEQAWVVEYNKSHSDCTIEVKEYGSFELLNADIVAGNGPDIINLYRLDTSPYIEKGILADLSSFLDTDPELIRDDLIPSTLEVYERDGQLYGITVGFHLTTLMGRTDDVGIPEDWTFEKVCHMLEDMPEGTWLVDTSFGGSLLSQVLSLNLDQFIDWENGTCAFDQEEFIRLLETAGRYPSDYDDTVEALISEGRLLTHRNWTSSPSDTSYSRTILGEANIVYIGFPTPEGGKNLIDPSYAYGISASCTDQKAAWEFIRSFLSEEFQETYIMNHVFPARQSSLLKRMNQHLGLSVTSSSNGYVLTHSVTEEDIEMLYDAIYNATNTESIDSTVINIIEEESAAYFNGDKAAQDVAEIIQSRVSIYISEKN